MPMRSGVEDFSDRGENGRSSMLEEKDAPAM